MARAYGLPMLQNYACGWALSWPGGCCCCCCCRVGAALLRGEWQAAVRLIMQGGPGERREYRQARALYMEQGDIQVGTFPVAQLEFCN
jgi:hypothetical protein